MLGYRRRVVPGIPDLEVQLPSKEEPEREKVQHDSSDAGPVHLNICPFDSGSSDVTQQERGGRGGLTQHTPPSISAWNSLCRASSRAGDWEASDAASCLPAQSAPESEQVSGLPRTERIFWSMLDSGPFPCAV